MKKKRLRAVRADGTPGTYTPRVDRQLRTKGYEGAKYKLSDTREEARKTFASSPHDYIKRNASTGSRKSGQSYDTDTLYPTIVPENSLAVDAACSRNPSAMEYRGVRVTSRQQVFHSDPIYGTNNIGEFLAIAHGLALLKQRGLDIPIYSDSANAVNWAERKKCKTKLPRDPRTEGFSQLTEHAGKWLRENAYSIPIPKWGTR